MMCNTGSQLDYKAVVPNLGRDPHKGSQDKSKGSQDD